MEKSDRFVGQQSGQMDCLALDRVEILTLSGETVKGVELVFGKRPTESPLADEPSSIPGLSEECGISLGEKVIRQRLVKTVDLVASGVHSREYAGATGHTDGGRAEIVHEQDARGRQSVYMGCVNDRIPRAAERIPALVIRDEQDEVWPGGPLPLIGLLRQQLCRTPPRQECRGQAGLGDEFSTGDILRVGHGSLHVFGFPWPRSL